MWDRFFARDLSPEELPALEAGLSALEPVQRVGWLRQGRGRLSADRGGLHCERLFGPLARDACSCGKWSGAEHRGVRCDRCGVTVGDPAERSRRWARLACPVGLIHPALLARALRDLGEPGDPLAWDGEDETLPVERLERRWGHPVRVRQIPVSPPAGRSGDPLARGHLPVPRPEEQALIALTRRTLRLNRLVELRAPVVILAGEMAAASQALARYLERRGEEGSPRRFLEAPERPLRLPARRPPPRRRAAWEGRRPWIDGLAFWGDRLLACGARGVFRLELSTGRWRRVPCGEASLLGVADGCAVFEGVSWPVRRPDDELALEASHGFASLDLASGRWIDRLPAALTLAFGRDQPEDGWVEELATGQVDDLDLSSDRPARGAYTPDLRDMLVLDDEDGLVLDGGTGQALLWLREPTSAPLRLAGGGREVEPYAEDRGGPPALVHLGGRRWRALLPSGVLVEVDDEGRTHAQWVLPGAYTAAAFDLSGERLAVARGGAVRILDPDGRLLQQSSLPSRGRAR